MKYKLLTFLLLFSFCLHAQSLKIPDYRTNKESFKKLKNKTLRKELADFTIAGENGDKSDIALQEIPLVKSDSSFVTFNKDSLNVTILTGIFDGSEHKLSYYDRYLVKIDDKPFWGTGGDMPTTTILSVRVMIGNNYIEIPFTALSDLFSPNLCWTNAKSKGTNCRTGVYLSNDGKRIYITMVNGTGAGIYEVTWIIENGKYLRRVVDYGF
jgi:hypothetical protein